MPMTLGDMYNPRPDRGMNQIPPVAPAAAPAPGPAAPAPGAPALSDDDWREHFARFMQGDTEGMHPDLVADFTGWKERAAAKQARQRAAHLARRAAPPVGPTDPGSGPVPIPGPPGSPDDGQPRPIPGGPTATPIPGPIPEVPYGDDQQPRRLPRLGSPTDGQPRRIPTSTGPPKRAKDIRNVSMPKKTKKKTQR